MILGLRECPNCHRESPAVASCHCSLDLVHEHYRCPACGIHVHAIPVVLYGGEESWAWQVEQPEQDVALTGWVVTS